VSIAGASHVCVGGDFMAQLVRSGTVSITLRELATLPPGFEPGTPVAGLEGPQDYPAVAEALRRRGHDEGTVAGLLHGNLFRFLRRALPAQQPGEIGGGSIRIESPVRSPRWPLPGGTPVSPGD
jgi:membrane dipeptidase